ncbi:unnamed protein product (macronuclear) [Paramecium tetraurelia]|uniref:B30.2/SPRY domain-containing protein n=1 Tax=Paramecium tetraurelia TaxID=5888 RepID=A0C7M9_PARTE|nr:uncharacterized protein GSPATT00035926001 [Paramecium tetraurelia]CAK66796.1 unnamed protein product [Paramecium tetraurelia]|eukprot:XP_001434193.1 hypothetical protein (macronuclear) [Paramecium tetraurelia strain d4-2]
MSGYDINLFQPKPEHHYICLVCNKIVKDPQECGQCGQMYCNVCVTQKPTCKSPSCQKVMPQQYNKIQGAMLKAYKNLTLSCPNVSCKKIFTIVDFEQHQTECVKSKCQNYDVCNEFITQEKNISSLYCSVICECTDQLHNNAGVSKKQFEIIKQYVTQLSNSPSQIQSIQTQNIQQQPIVMGNGGIVFKWDKNKCGQSIQLSNDNASLFLKENSHIFRSVLGDIPFERGIHYWEIEGDSRTENELKIGVVVGNNINLNAAFCDFPQGFAYYGLSQLRNGQTNSGQSYGKKFKNEGVLGVCLNMNNGTLSFQLNNDYMGIAFRSELLKKGPIYAAVAVLHCGGCTVRSGKPVPKYME